MCQRIGLPPTRTMGLGRNSVSSRIRVPRPPAKITAVEAIEGLLAIIDTFGGLKATAEDSIPKRLGIKKLRLDVFQEKGAVGVYVAF